MDPFFEYFTNQNRHSISDQLYGEPTSRHKEYKRFPQISLPPPEVIHHDITDALRTRASTRDFSATPISLQALSTLLYWSFGRIEHSSGEKRRPQPSGGAKYPIEIYIVAQNTEEIPRGVYHYHVPGHRLEQIILGEYKQIMTSGFFYPFVKDASVIICMTFMKARSMGKYGNAAYKFGLIEAGHVGQNVYLLSRALNIGCCGLGGGHSKQLHELIGLDGVSEHVIYGIMLGNVQE